MPDPAEIDYMEEPMEPKAEIGYIGIYRCDHGSCQNAEAFNRNEYIEEKRAVLH